MRDQHERFMSKPVNVMLLLFFNFFILISSFFIANFMLHFLQALLVLIQQVTDNPKNISFSIDWGSFFVYQRKYFLVYIAFYIVVIFGLFNFNSAIKRNHDAVKKWEHEPYKKREVLSELEIAKETKKLHIRKNGKKRFYMD
ncbi:hypothetical protein [Peribacillus asahii]|uniref:hypothetical protein n=1 Tax=Peribacillus asahii TaxID=228899 RepID=UPI00207A405D|nr:hypothetical protein [Peribacillus asahii]USK62339.1 hypothetical protein LIT37_22840 [Peribacillus asahii]